jgi:DNA-binding LacI/PurR family transcriptional regulator
MSKVTIADVARLANVSTSSVSNVLNDRTNLMRPDTKVRIQHAIDKLGYTVNLAARQLKTGHAPIIGLIIPSVANPFYGIFAHLIEKTALMSGYQVLLGNSERNPERERRYGEELWGYGVRGIIFGSSLTQFTHLENLIKKGMYVVAFEGPTQQQDKVIIDSISIDNVQAMRLTTKHLLALGHNRIGFVSGPIRTVSRLDRLEGYRGSLKDANVEFDQQLVWQGATSNFGDTAAVELGRQGAHDLLSKSKPPTAIVAINDMYAFGVYAGARDLGLKIPDDVSVTGVDDITLTEVVEPPLTTVQQPLRDITRLAVERLINRLHDTCSHPPGHQTLPPKLIVRKSTARYQKS